MPNADSPSSSVVKDEITGEKKTIEWTKYASEAEKTLSLALEGLKKLRETINLCITLTEKSETLRGFADAMNGAINGAPHLIFCENKSGWMDVGYCKHMCKSKCSKYTSGRWICNLLRCSSEKITMCDVGSIRCQSAGIIMRFADKYADVCYSMIREAKRGSNN